MSRVQLALNVDDLDEAIAFYSKLFNTQPAKVKEGYANFAVTEPPLKLVLLQNPGQGGTINHLGVEVESSDTVHAEIARLAGEGLFTEEEMNTTCCFATQRRLERLVQKCRISLIEISKRVECIMKTFHFNRCQAFIWPPNGHGKTEQEAA